MGASVIPAGTCSLKHRTSLNIAVNVLDTSPKLAKIVFFGLKTFFDGRNNVSYDFSSIFISLPSL